LVSCKKDVSEIKIQNPQKFSEVFDEFWIGMDQNYMYWDIDTTNWKVMYSKYKPYFVKLDMKNNHDVKKSVQYFREMTKGLIDGHYSISFLPDAIKDSIVYPSYERKQSLSGFHYPFSYFKIDTNYLDKDFILGFNNAFSNAGVPLSALSGTINHKILYFGCNSFALSKSYFDQTQNGVKPVLQYFFDSLKDLSGNIKAVIIDVRSNAGGDLNDLNFLIGRFIDKPLHFGYVQYKTGNGRLDFTPWMNAVINPVSNSTAISVSVVVLADNVSASLSEAVVMAIQTLPNGVFIGERTWGATRPVASEDTYNAGSFTVNGFLSVQSSSCRFKYLNGKSYEGKGYPPDIQVQFKLNDLNNGKDAALEKAIDYINSKIN
jgi:hypothetical protein